MRNRIIARFATLAVALATTSTLALAPAGAEPAIDGYQPYVAARNCTDSAYAKPGVVEFKDVLISRMGGSNGGIVACSGYEHMEGRALDWMNNASVPAEAARVQKVLDWMLATDADGNAHAMARRLGIAYVIWNERVINLYDSDKSWKTYTCDGSAGGCHRNHVHFAFSWAAANRQTSWFTANPRPAHWYPDTPGTRRAPTNDFNGDGYGDLVAVNTTNGELVRWQNAGGGMQHIGTYGPGWGGYRDLTGGDFNGDGYSDLVAVNTTNGELVRWQNAGGGMQHIGTYGPGWGGYRDLTAVDYNRDGRSDLVAISSDGRLVRWVNTGSWMNFDGDFGPGWGGYGSLTGGDFNGDGYGDLVAVNTTNGELVRWQNAGGGMQHIGTYGPGWGGYRDLTGGDFNGDGYGDLVAVNTTNGELVRWQNAGGGMQHIGTYGPGWNGYRNLV
ncbi:FG-GAP-like repeat-containing protein [Kitasatospora sp. NPDC096147]|uniref:FG-GAP-like repeat-containing protein n=1 Tax=Kitasatospora sp. NPDC096147 TaxID=3364093 RepID=UPI00381ECB76